MTTQKPSQTGSNSNWFSVPVQAAPATVEAQAVGQIGQQPLSRRRALAGTAAALAGAAAVNLGAIAVSRAAGKGSVAEPLPAPAGRLAMLFERYRRQWAHYIWLPEQESAATFDAAYEQLNATRLEIEQTSAKTPHDVLAVLEWILEDEFGLFDESAGARLEYRVIQSARDYLAVAAGKAVVS